MVGGFLINQTGCDGAEMGGHLMGITEALTVKQINQQMDQLAREIGTLDPNDSRRPDLIDEMSRLSMLLAELRKRQRDN